jgi:hypothetical protein
LDFGIVPTLLSLAILRRRLANPLDDVGIRDDRDGLLDPFHLDLMIPVVAEVEPITKDAIRL